MFCDGWFSADRSVDDNVPNSALFQMLVEPIGPAAVDVHLANGIAGEMSADGIGEEFHFDAVVFERVKQRIRLRDRDARVAGVVQ